MTEEQIRQRLDVQDWRCVYPCGDDHKTGGPILPGDVLGVAYDGHGLAHLSCAGGGIVAPERSALVEIRNPEATT